MTKQKEVLLTMYNQARIMQAPSCPGGTLYTIRPGDALYILAPRFNTTIEAIIAANPGINPNNIQIGQIICIPVPPQPGQCPGGFLYEIRPGDTYYSIARRFGIAVEALVAANPGVDPNALRVGQRICVPAPRPPAPCPGGTYRIQAGDTFFSIARRFGTTVEALIAANPQVDPNRLQVGQTICLPTGIPGPIPCPGGTIYRVQAGETLYAISRRFGLTVEEVIAANPQLINPNQLQIGQAICIPSAG